MRRDWRVWIPISCGRRLVPTMSKIGPTNVQEPWCLSNAASTTMITMSTTMICSKRAVPSKLNCLKWKLVYFHTYYILELWISTLLETISWVWFQVPLRRRWSGSVVQPSRSLKSSQGSEGLLSDLPGEKVFVVVFVFCICLYLCREVWVTLRPQIMLVFPVKLSNLPADYDLWSVRVINCTDHATVGHA